MTKLTRGNCLLFSLKYRFQNKDTKLHWKWNKGSKTPSFQIKHYDALIRYRRKSLSDNRFWFEGNITVEPIKQGFFNVVQGNLLDMFDAKQFNAIAHGCNLRGTLMKGMSGGIAGQIERRYREARNADMMFHKYVIRPIGEFSAIKEEVYLDQYLGRMSQANNLDLFHKQTIYNLYTQINPGADFRLDALERAVDTLIGYGKAFFDFYHQLPHIGLPEIGCGIGGGDPKQVYPVLQRLTKYWNVTIVVFDPSQEKIVVKFGDREIIGITNVSYTKSNKS